MSAKDSDARAEEAMRVLDRFESAALRLRVRELEGQVFSLNEQAQRHRSQMAEMAGERDHYRDWARKLANRLGFMAPGDSLVREWFGRRP